MPTKLGIRDAFARYGATLHNVQWSVSAWTPNDELVLSLWAHHHQGPRNSMEYRSTTARWGGPGKNEFVTNMNRAFKEKRPVRLVIATTKEPERVEAGEDGSSIPKTFHTPTTWIGEIVEWDGESYVIRFAQA